MSGKSTEYLNWDDYFMALACVAAQRSKDPNTKVGACIANSDNRVVALGYNGMPNGCDDDVMPWGRSGNWEDTKFPYVCHAETNAIMNKTSSDLKGCVMYSTLFPCNECAKLIIQSGISKVHFLSDKHHDRPSTITARRLFDTASIPYWYTKFGFLLCCQLIPQRNIVINFAEASGKNAVVDNNNLKKMKSLSLADSS